MEYRKNSRRTKVLFATIHYDSHHDFGFKIIRPEALTEGPDIPVDTDDDTLLESDLAGHVDTELE